MHCNRHSILETQKKQKNSGDDGVAHATSESIEPKKCAGALGMRFCVSLAFNTEDCYCHCNYDEKDEREREKKRQNAKYKHAPTDWCL